MLVEDRDPALRHVHRLDADVLVDPLHFVEDGLGRVVGEQDAVHAEHAAVGLVPEVAAVGPVAVARCGVIGVERLVHPVPDGGAADEVGRFDGLPVIDQVASGVAHRVGVFGDVERVLDGVSARCGAADPVDRRVLVRAHVHDVVVALVLYRTRGVEGVQGLVGRDEVPARAGLVAQRPDHHRGVVHMGVGQLHDTGHVGCLELRDVRERGLAVVVFVAFEVGLVLEVDAVLVAEVVPVRGAGVVRVADVVDVAALHEHDLLLHLLRGDGVAHGGIDLLAVHALELHGPAVDVVVAPGQPELILCGGRVADLDLAEAEGRREGLHHAALPVAQLPDERVAPRLLGRPLAGVGHPHPGYGQGGLSGLRRSHCGRGRHPIDGCVLVRIEFVGVERVGERIALGGLPAEVADVGLDAYRAVGIGGVEVGPHTQVADLHPGCRGERDGAEDARQAEHVLRLEERAVGVAVDLHGHDVLAPGVQVGGDVERGGVARVLRETHVTAVHPEVEERRDAVKVDVDLAFLPRFGQRERAAVGSHLVAVPVSDPVRGRGAHHAAAPVVHGHLVGEDHRLVGVDRHAVAEAAVLLDARHVPLHRHRHVVPCRHVVFGFVELRGALFGVAGPVELPHAVE